MREEEREICSAKGVVLECKSQKVEIQKLSVITVLCGACVSHSAGFTFSLKVISARISIIMMLPTTSLESRPLVGNWSWLQYDGNATEELDVDRLADLSASTKWRPCAGDSPSNIHTELLHAHMIKDLFLLKNAELCQWVGETAWLYRCDNIQIDRHHAYVDLVFEGLDTFCTAYLVYMPSFVFLYTHH